MRRNSKRLNVLISSLLVCALPCWYALADSNSPTHEPTATAALEVSPTMAATASLPPDAEAARKHRCAGRFARFTAHRRAYS